MAGPFGLPLSQCYSSCKERCKERSFNGLAWELFFLIASPYPSRNLSLVAGYIAIGDLVVDESLISSQWQWWQA